MSKLAVLMAHQEGFFVPGSLPQRNNNPLDLRHAPGETHPDAMPDSVGSFPTPEAGWAAGERQLQLFAERGLTLGEAIAIFAPPTENNTSAYLDFVCKGLNCDPSLSVAEALKIS